MQLSKVKGCLLRALHKAEVGGINVFYEEKRFYDGRQYYYAYERTILMSQVTGKMDALRGLVRYAIFYTAEMLQFPTVHLDEDVPDLYIDLKMVDKLHG